LVKRFLSPKALQLADESLAIAREIDPSLELKRNKFYVGLSKGQTSPPLRTIGRRV
jgi:hypothetical protein